MSRLARLLVLLALALPSPARAQDDGSAAVDPSIQPPPGIAPTPAAPAVPPPPPSDANGNGTAGTRGPNNSDITNPANLPPGTTLPPGLPPGILPPGVTPPTTPATGGGSGFSVSKGRVAIPADSEASARELGKKLFHSGATSLTGRSCADCHSAPFLAKVAHVYPRYHILERDVLTRAEAFQACARRWMKGWSLPPGSPQSVALELYLEGLVGSDG